MKKIVKIRFDYITGEFDLAGGNAGHLDLAKWTGSAWVKITEAECEVCDRCDAEEATEVKISYESTGGTGSPAHLSKMLCRDCLAVVLRSMDKRKRSTPKDSG